MQGKYVLASVGILGVTVIEVTALSHGIDGVMLSTCVGAILALVGGVTGFSIGIKQNLSEYTKTKNQQ